MVFTLPQMDKRTVEATISAVTWSLIFIERMYTFDEMSYLNTSVGRCVNHREFAIFVSAATCLLKTALLMKNRQFLFLFKYS